MRRGVLALVSILTLSGVLTFAPPVRGAGPAVLTADVCGCFLTVFVSLNDNVQGDWIGGHFWGRGPDNNMHFTRTLTPGVKNFVHVLVEPPNNNRTLFCYLTLTGGATFANAGTTLDSNPAYWVESTTGWGVGNHKPGVAPNSGIYVIQDQTIFKEDPGCPVLIDATGGEGFQQKIYFSTVINPAP